MPKHSKDHTPPPGERGTPEAMPSQEDLIDPALWNDATGAEGQVVPAASDSPEATAPSPITEDAFLNPALPEQTSNLDPPPAELGTTEQTPSHEDLGDAAASNDAADAESQVAPATSDGSEATATSPAGADGFGNPALPEQTSNLNQPPAEPGTTELTPSHEDLGDAAASKDETGVKDRVVPPSSGGPEASPAAAATKRIIKVTGIKEFVRVGIESGMADYWCPQYSVDAEYASGFQELVNQADYHQKLQKERVLPHRPEFHGTTSELFTGIKHAIVERTPLAGNASALSTFWLFTTWFQEFLPIAPCLAITGSAHEGDLVLRTLRAFCRCGHLVAGLTMAKMGRFFYTQTPTLLIFEPNLSKRMASFLGCTTRRGYMEEKDRYFFDHFCSKAIYLGENLPLKSMLQHCVHIDASPTPGVETHYAPPLSEAMTLKFQNRLLDYRITSMFKVFRSDFNASGLSAETNAITNAMGKCIIDAPDLHAELVSLITPYSEQQIAERLDDLATLAVGAALSLCHQGKDRILVGEIVAKVNRIQKDRGERLQCGAEQVGRRLNKVGLPTRRLGPARMGLLMDHATQVLLHKIAADYGCAGLTDGEENLHCPLCEQNK